MLPFQNARAMRSQLLFEVVSIQLRGSGTSYKEISPFFTFRESSRGPETQGNRRPEREESRYPHSPLYIPGPGPATNDMAWELLFSAR